jgi:hypothetical protein
VEVLSTFLLETHPKSVNKGAKTAHLDIVTLS